MSAPAPNVNVNAQLCKCSLRPERVGNCVDSLNESLLELACEAIPDSGH